MGTLVAVAEAQLQASVQESLALFQYDTAKFLAERLVALHNTELNQQLLATCYIHANQAYRAYHMLKGHNSQRSRYLLAVACMNMSRYPEAKDALLKLGEAEIPYGAAGLYLLAKVCRLTSSHADARDYYYRALRLNPLLWSAYEELCAVGGDEEAAELCSSALSPMRSAAEAEGPSPSTSSQVSSALAHTPPHGHHGAAAQGQLPHGHGGHGHHGGGGHRGHGAAGVGKEHGRMPAQQHRPAGPPSTSGAPVSMGYGGFRGNGFGGAGQGPAGAPPPVSLFGVPPSTGGPAAAGGGLFQTPVQGQGGLFASPVPVFGGFGTAQTGGTAAQQPPTGLATVYGFGAAGVTGAGECGDAGPGTAAPPSTGGQFFRFGPPASGAPGTGGGMFATPSPTGAGPQPPAPPQKNHPGQSEVPFPGFAAGPGPSASGAAGGSGPGAGGAVGGGFHHRISGRMMDEGKVRKVSNKLFSDPRSSVRRSQRLAALNTAAAGASGSGGSQGPTGSGGMSGMGGGGGLFASYYGGPSASVQGQAKSGQASYVEGDSQNMPDPRDPPPAPVQQQLHPDAKLGGPAGATPQQLLAAFGGRPQQAGADTFPAALGPSAAANGAAAASAAVDGRGAVLQLLAPLLEGVRHLAAFRCQEAVAAFGRLPMAQYRTAWVMCAVGRAHFESINYPKAAQHFELARQLDRTRVEDMEVYSTVLWHTKREYELSHLAQEMVATDRLAPQTWCVMGNLFSGQKEHEAAIEFFLRAVQVCPTFTYAYTLAAHEHYANEDYDKAASCYRAALKLDPRHYNALYGLGQIHYRQEKYAEALQSFRAASTLHPRSSVLCCYVGMSAAKMGQHHLALDKLQESVELDPNNPLARYERAAVLASLDRLHEALAELEALQRVAPGEASVAFQMGKLYKRLNNLTAAQLSFEMALSYGAGNSSSDAAMIKAAIERLGLSEDEEEEEI